MSDHSVAHGTFVIDREFAHPVGKVFSAWADPAKKAKWFGDPSSDNPAQVFEFRPGGRESNSGKIPNGPTYNFDVTYQDIVPDNRILYTYDMHMDGKKISVSLAAIEFEARGAGTRMKITEYGLFLDGLDNVEQRKAGTVGLIEQLAVFLGKE
ncbi:MAG: SRPBCC family protein [Devosia sp.]|nr:SRPBCC family protein [Devosia sp.]